MCSAADALLRGSFCFKRATFQEAGPCRVTRLLLQPLSLHSHGTDQAIGALYFATSRRTRRSEKVRKMPGLNTTLTWAIPVAAEVLGAHLDAYLTLLPTINALRACHRYAQDKPVSRLPVELVTIIEDFLIAEEREKKSLEWNRDFRCFQQDCDFDDESEHFSEDELEDMQLEDCTKHLGSMLCDETCSACLEDHLSIATLDRCNERYFSWRDKEMIFHHSQREILLQNFGLRIWTETVRLPSDYKGADFKAFETTIAYLILPRSTVTRTEWNLSELVSNISRSSCLPRQQAQRQPLKTCSCAQRYLLTLMFLQETDDMATDHEFNFFAGCAMEIGNLSLPKGARKKFTRMMQILGVTPRLHPSQDGQKLHVDKEPVNACKEDKNERPAEDQPATKKDELLTQRQLKHLNWPRLTMLVGADIGTES